MDDGEQLYELAAALGKQVHLPKHRGLIRLELSHRGGVCFARPLPHFPAENTSKYISHMADQGFVQCINSKRYERGTHLNVKHQGV